MSNHTETTIEDIRLEQWRREMNAELGKLSRSYNATVQEANNLISSLCTIQNALTRVYEKCKFHSQEIASQLEYMNSEVQRFMSVIDATGAMASDLERKSSEYITEGEKCIDESNQQAQRAYRQLHGMYESLSASLEECYRIGEVLQKDFSAIEEIMHDILTEQKRSEYIESLTSGTWKEVQLAVNEFIDIQKQWKELYQSYSSVYKDLNSMASNITVMSFEGEEAAIAAYNIVRTLQDESFSLAAMRRSTMGIEAFFKDTEERMISLQVRANRKVERSILLELDLSNYDVANRQMNCDAQIHDLLDKISEHARLSKTRVSHPERRAPMDSMEREVTGTRDRSKSPAARQSARHRGKVG